MRKIMRVWCQMVFKKIIIKKWVKPPKVYPNFCLVLFLLVVLYVWLGSAIWGCFFISYSTPPPPPPPTPSATTLLPQQKHPPWSTYWCDTGRRTKTARHVTMWLHIHWLIESWSCELVNCTAAKKESRLLKDIGRKPNQLRRWLAVLRRSDRSRWNSSLHAVTQSIVFCFFFLSESGTSRHDRDVAGTLTLW